MTRFLGICCGVIFTCINAFGSTIPESWGFEIGNGRPIYRTLNGIYGVPVDGSWKVTLNGRFTEIVASLVEGTPRARLRIDMVTEDRIQSFDSLVDLFVRRATGWAITTVGDLNAVQKEVTLGNGRCVLDMRVFRAPKEVAVIALDSAPDCKGASSYEKIKNSLDTFRFIQ